MGAAHFDTDDFVWFTTDALPYRRRRNTQHRLTMLTEALENEMAWVLSGSLCGWGDVLIDRFDRVIYLTAQAEVRCERIQQRETLRYGAERIGAGGDLHVVYDKFAQWAADYDTPSDNVRSAAKELLWLNERITCPVLHLDSTDMSSDLLIESSLAWLADHETR